MHVEVRSKVNSVFGALHNKILDRDVIPAALEAKSEKRVVTPNKFIANRYRLALKK